MFRTRPVRSPSGAHPDRCTTAAHRLDRDRPVGYSGAMATIDPFASATELLDALRAGRTTSSELTDLYIRRVERHDGRLNAVVVRDFDRARQRARAADEAAARGERAPLLGLPITLKESLNVAGLPTTCGVPDWKGYVS